MPRFELRLNTVYASTDSRIADKLGQGLIERLTPKGAPSHDHVGQHSLSEYHVDVLSRGSRNGYSAQFVLAFPPTDTPSRNFHSFSCEAAPKAWSSTTTAPIPFQSTSITLL